MTVTMGILAHVDAGKTTLSEQLLAYAGVIRTPGRVDAGTTLLDSDPVERQRGITVFSAQAELTLGGESVTLIDTPGHVDFAAEAERCMAVLDLAVLLADGGDGVQAHTRTLFEMTGRYGIPAVFFLNKNDLPSFDESRALAGIAGSLTKHAVPVRNGVPDAETLADADDAFCERWLSGSATDADAWDTLLRLTAERKAFPVLTGAALSGTGVPQLAAFLGSLAAVIRQGKPDLSDQPFRARVWQVRYDGAGARVVHLRVTEGMLHTRQAFIFGENAEKINQIRLYRGAGYVQTDAAGPGDTVGVTGLTGVRCGDTFTETAVLHGGKTSVRPVLCARVEPEDGTPSAELLEKLKLLTDEDPALDAEWDGEHGCCIVHIMGTVQTEVLTRVLEERFGIRVRFMPPRVLYRETVRGTSIGCGHYEPLRHYAEVRLRLEEAPRGSGITFESHCHEDVLVKNFQRLIRTHVSEKRHRGVLTGSELTDVRVVLLCGRDHPKHTEGGDFREATYRAIRQGLMKADCILLEPFYRFRIRTPAELSGRIMTDITAMAGTCEIPEITGDTALVRGRCPVAAMMDYPVTLRSFSRGKADISLEADGYDPCHDPERVIREADYDPDADRENPSGSVFCSHGAGYFVPWREADGMMHIGTKDYTETGPRDLD